jgi:hypothetical protein
MATGKLGVVGEHDWLAVTLQADQAYLFTVTGLTGDGTVEVLPASLGGDNFAFNSVITPRGHGCHRERVADADHHWHLLC